MIYEVTVRDQNKTPVKWFPNVEWLKHGPFNFGPGLTLLFGPNGSGKSTLIRAFSRLFHCEQSGRQVITYESMRNVKEMGDGINEPIFLESAGQDHVARLNAIFARKPQQIEDRINDVRGMPKAEADARKFLRETFSERPICRPTLILDEPERSLSLPLRGDWWRIIAKTATEMQIIAATHDPMVLNMPVSVATFIETEPGYIQKCKKVIVDMTNWE